MIKLSKSRTIAATPETVFDTITQPDHIVCYFPVTSVEIDPKTGGALTIRGEAGEEPFTDYGIIEHFERPTHFQYRYWSTNHGTERTDANHMTIDYRIEPVDSGSVVLHLQHINLLTDERRTQMDAVWDHLLSALQNYAEARKK